MGLCPACLLRNGLGADTSPPSSPQHRSPFSSYQPYTPPAPHELAPLFPQLEIIELVGRGGMGFVYKARQIHLDRLVAVKVLPKLFGDDPSFEQRFSREARAMARLNHPNIVNVHDFGQAGEFYYFVMEFVDGPNLRQTLLAQRLKPAEALGIIPAICDALQYAHDEGIVHRDIKPENILLDKRGRVKIADFGLAKLLLKAPLDYTLTQTQMAIGTPHYMAPEQMEHPLEVDHRADIYSLGVVLYEMLTGELPLGRFAPPSHKADVDARLDEVVFKTLEKEPENRYQNASEVKTGVADASAPAPRGADPVPVISYVQRRATRYSRAAVAGAVWAILGAATALIALAGMIVVGSGPAAAAAPLTFRAASGTVINGRGGSSSISGWRSTTITPDNPRVIIPSTMPVRVEDLNISLQPTTNPIAIRLQPIYPAATTQRRAGSPSATRAAASGGSGGVGGRPAAVEPGPEFQPVRVHVNVSGDEEGATFQSGTAGGGAFVYASAPRGSPVWVSWLGSMSIYGLLFLPLLALALTSPFGTTILGIVAIDHIRHSAGEIRGMRLAVLDAIAFPLLLVNVVLLLVPLMLFSRFIAGAGGTWVVVAPLALVTMAGLIVADWWVYQAVLRTCRRGI
jgi:hypothetical protein